MSPLLIKISKDFATLFTTINPIATLALFAGLTASLSRAERHCPSGGALPDLSSAAFFGCDSARDRAAGRVRPRPCHGTHPLLAGSGDRADRAWCRALGGAGGGIAREQKLIRKAGNQERF